MSSKREALRLEDIIENIADISIFLEGDVLSSADLRKVRACERCLEIIAEAVVKIGAERMAVIAPAIRFERIRGLGNALRHAYDTIDLLILDRIVAEELPVLRDAAIAALGRA